MADNPTSMLAARMARTSDVGLLKVFAALTHRLHAARETRVVISLRARRDIVEAEILKRMGQSKKV